MSQTYTLNDQLQGLLDKLAPHVKAHTTYQGELSVVVELTKLHDLLMNLKEAHGFNYLTDITATDHYRDDARFEVSYNIYNLDSRQRIRVKTFVEEESLEVPTATDIWPSANWPEREAYDMIGVRFSGHPDLRRMYMPEDFQFFPLRKEFPLIGIPGSIQMPEKVPPKGYK
jgi:NADH-quinone oxidoreductase subunit C